MKHAEKHPSLDEPGCFGCRIAHVNISADAIPSRRADSAMRNQLERDWSVDMPAYKRLREDGLQPEQVDGARNVELLATERHHVEGTPDPKIVERFEDVMA